MALFTGSSEIVPHFISDNTPEGLKSKILRLQRIKGKEYKFISFYFDGSKHIGWYYELQDFKDELENKK